MAKTLEEIKGMNLQVGTPIEVEINTSISEKLEKLSDNTTYKELGYYQGICQNDSKYGTLLYEHSTQKNPNNPPHGVLIPLIESITIK
jgi:hypothetical protein